MKTIPKLIITIILYGFSSLITAQEAISAHIIDAETRQPIDLVSVVSSVSGTITNREGGFIVRADSTDYLEISHISYLSQTIPVEQLGDTVFLQPQIYELAEFIIMPREVIVRELTAVWEKYNNLLRGKRERDSPIQTFYYRQLTQNEGIYVEYMEAFFTAPTTIYVTSLTMHEGRYARVRDPGFSAATVSLFTYAHMSPFSPREARTRHALNPLLVKDFERYYDLSISRIIAPDSDDEVVVYNFKPYGELIGVRAAVLTGQLYVRTKDRAIVRMDASTRATQVPQFTNRADQIHTYTITFRDGIASYPVVESIRVDAEYFHFRDGQPRYTKIYATLYAIDTPMGSRGRRVRYDQSLQHQVINSRYNQEFWNNNPFIMRTSVEQRVLDDFNRAGYFGSMNMSE
jgi:hypothetical protein